MVKAHTDLRFSIGPAHCDSVTLPVVPALFALVSVTDLFLSFFGHLAAGGEPPLGCLESTDSPPGGASR
jgi:hypothetical protein